MPYPATLRAVVADLARIDMQDRPKRCTVGGVSWSGLWSAGLNVTDIYFGSPAPAG